HMRRLVFLGESVDQALCVISAIGDDAREVPGELWKGRVKALLDELSMWLVLGEYDRLAEPVSAFDLHALLHEVRDHLAAPSAERQWCSSIAITTSSVRSLTPWRHLPFEQLLMASAASS